MGSPSGDLIHCCLGKFRLLSLFSINFHIDLQKSPKSQIKCLKNATPWATSKILWTQNPFFLQLGPSRHEFRPSPWRHKSSPPGAAVPATASATAPATFLPLHAKNLLPKRNILPVACTRLSKNCHRTTLIKMKILSGRRYHAKSIGLTVCSLLAAMAHKIIMVKIRVREDTGYSA